METAVIFERLVDNAFDFLRQSLSEIETKPKYSIIHFNSAVELFLKARLMSEHWSLVISESSQPDWKKFNSGNFKSVSLDGAALRLKKVVRSGLSDKQLIAFRGVANHRNKAVHFYHEAHSPSANDSHVLSVVKQQLTAWYHLHYLLTEQWRPVFNQWQIVIRELDSELKKLKGYLEVSFEQMKSEIDQRIEGGEEFIVCRSCDFQSQPLIAELNAVHSANCLTCDFGLRTLQIACPECKSPVLFMEEAFGECSECHARFEPQVVAQVLLDSAEAHVAAMEGGYHWGTGNCSDCDGYQTVAKTASGIWICAGCLLTKSELEYCEWCNEANTGNMEASYLIGCNMCDGKSGWERDD